MKTFKKIILIIIMILIALFVFFILGSDVKSSNKTQYLYIGNSKTFRNNLPEMYKNLIQSLGKEENHYKAVTKGGRTLRAHANVLESLYKTNGEVRTFEQAKKYIETNFNMSLEESEYKNYLTAFSQKWDYVILQEGLHNDGDEEIMLESAKRIIEVLRKYGKNSDFKIVYNAINWNFPENEKLTLDERLAEFNINQTKLNRSNKNVAKKTGGVVAYTGQAMYNYIKEYSRVEDVLVSDLNHPTQLATYMAACSIYSAIYNESPVGISYQGAVEITKENLVEEELIENQLIDENTEETVKLNDLGDKKVKRAQNIVNKTMINNIPQIESLTLSNEKPTNNNIKINVLASETAFELDEKPYSWDSMETWTNKKTHEVSKNGTYKVYVRDNIGNVNSKSIKVTNIDKTAPTLNVSYSTTEPTNGKVTVTLTSNEKVQGISGWILSEDKLSLTKTYTANKTETVTVKDLIGNSSILEVKITNIVNSQLEISSEKYKIENDMISKIKLNTKMLEFKTNIKSNMSYVILNNNNEMVKDEDIIGTGYKIKFNSGKYYNLIVTGDISGDGNISVTDLSKIKKHIIQSQLLVNSFKVAGDISGDGKISITDLSIMKKVILGVANI